jgi:hypothetical protein
MNQFVFTLKDNNQKAYNTFFWFVYFLHLIAAAVIINNSGDTQQKALAVGVFMFILAGTGIFFLFKNKFKLFSYQLLMFVLMVIFWLLQWAWLPAIIVIAVMIFALKVLKVKNMALFSSDNVIIKRSLFKKVYTWAVIENVVLKDGLLSVDLKNNQLIQLEPISTNPVVTEQQFNQFCQQQLLNPKP